mgnify:CR=1 FL=1
MQNHHPTAIIEKGAEIDKDVTIGAYAYIGAEVSIGAGTVIHHHATVEGFTSMGKSNEVFPYAFVGGKTHDLKFKGGRPGLKVGDHNVFREYSTIHCGTNDGDFTILGNHATILAYSHIAHDCVVKDHLIMSSHAALGGHIHADDYVNIGWGAGVHQFCSIGDHAMVSACAKVVQDIPPYMIVDGSPAEVRTINKIGMERNDYSKDEIELARKAFKTLYKEGLNRSQAIEKLKEDPNHSTRVFKALLSFIGKSSRGLA